MHHRVGVGDAWTGNVTTDALIDQGVQAGVKWASQTDAVQKLNQMAAGAIQGATVGAAIGTAIFPGIGTAVGTVAGAAVAFISNLVSGIGQHACSFTIYGGTPIPCAVYGRNVVSAADWVRSHPVDAITMHSSSLSQQFNIVEGDEIRKIVDEIKRVSNGHITMNPDDWNAMVLASQMPSASDLLRIAQVPAAAAWISAQPEKIPTAIFTLTDTFPALSIQDTNQIFFRAQPVYTAYLKKKQNLNKTVARMPSALQEKTESSTASKVVTGVALTAAAATIGTWVYARITHQTFRQVVKSWVPSAMRGRRRNPLPSALGSTTAGRVLAYRVRLGFLGGDAITFNSDGTATYTQQQRAVAVFCPTTYQLAKIRTGRGEVLIFTDQILRNLLAP